MKKPQKKSPKPPKEPNATSSEITTIEDIRQIVRDGKKFADRVGKELAAYAVEAETRRNVAASSAEEVESILADKPPKQTDPDRIERVKLDPFAAEKARLYPAVASLEFEATRHAAALILQTETKT